jgi:hypothetical protein
MPAVSTSMQKKSTGVRRGEIMRASAAATP